MPKLKVGAVLVGAMEEAAGAPKKDVEGAAPDEDEAAPPKLKPVDDCNAFGELADPKLKPADLGEVPLAPKLKEGAVVLGGVDPAAAAAAGEAAGDAAGMPKLKPAKGFAGAAFGGFAGSAACGLATVSTWRRGDGCRARLLPAGMNEAAELERALGGFAA